MFDRIPRVEIGTASLAILRSETEPFNSRGDNCADARKVPAAAVSGFLTQAGKTIAWFAMIHGAFFFALSVG